MPEAMPRLKIRFFFGAHSNADDAKFIETQIREFQPHFYSPEWAGMTRKQATQQAELLQGVIERIRRGGGNRRQALFEFGRYVDDKRAKEFLQAEFDALARCKRTPLVYLERFDDSLSEKMRLESGKFETMHLDAAVHFSLGDVKEAERLGLQRHEWLEATSRLREQNIIETIPRLLPELLERRPDLKGEKEIRVLARMGSGHSLLYRKLKEACRKAGAEIEVDRVFDEFHWVDPRDQLSRLEARGKAVPPEVRREKILQSTAGKALQLAFEAVFHSHPLAINVANALVARLNYAELCDLSKRLEKQVSSQKLELPPGVQDESAAASKLFAAPLFEVFKQKFAEKNIKLPKTKAELEQAFETLIKTRFGARWKRPFKPGEPLSALQ